MNVAYLENLSSTTTKMDQNPQTWEVTKWSPWRCSSMVSLVSIRAPTINLETCSSVSCLVSIRDMSSHNFPTRLAFAANDKPAQLVPTWVSLDFESVGIMHGDPFSKIRTASQYGMETMFSFLKSIPRKTLKSFMDAIEKIHSSPPWSKSDLKSPSYCARGWPLELTILSHPLFSTNFNPSFSYRFPIYTNFNIHQPLLLLLKFGCSLRLQSTHKSRINTTCSASYAWDSCDFPNLNSSDSLS